MDVWINKPEKIVRFEWFEKFKWFGGLLNGTFAQSRFEVV